MPAVMPGIDIEEALGRVSGNGKLLQDLLVDFAEQFGSAVQAIRDAVTRRETDEARRLAHTLKGTAGNLSAKALQAAALELESAIREGRTDKLEDAIEPVEQALSEVLAAARSLQRGDGAEPAAPAQQQLGDSDRSAAMDREALAPLLVELAAAIQDADPVAAGACLERVELEMAGAGPAEEIRQLAAQTDNFDFDEAHRTLTRVAEKLEVPLA